MRLPLLLVAMLAFTSCSDRSASRPSSAVRAPVEINLAGYGVAGKPGQDRLNHEYVFASDDTLRYFAGHGFKLIRLPIYWNRVQPEINGPLAPDQLALMEDFRKRAAKFGMGVVVDLHAFGRRDEKPVGSKELPISALVSFWAQFAKHFSGKFAGYDIMNEPHDMPTKQTWPEAAQATVDAIRKVDRKTTLYVEGDDWSNAGRWRDHNEGFLIKDPAKKLVYSAHIYFDQDTSGQYKVPFDKDGVSPQLAVDRLKPFVEWLRDHKVKGHIGEFGAPYADKRWHGVLDAFLDSVVLNRDVLTGVAYWAAGEYMDWYPLTLQPEHGGKWEDRPQLRMLMRPRCPDPASMLGNAPSPEKCPEPGTPSPSASPKH